MELVSALEGTAREVYTGAIGIASPSDGLELNVAIRTFELAGRRGLARRRRRRRRGLGPDPRARRVLRQGTPAAGGGRGRPRAVPRTVGHRADAGSAAEGSRAACRPAAGVFETMLVLDGRPVALESHLGRLAASVSSPLRMTALAPPRCRSGRGGHSAALALASAGPRAPRCRRTSFSFEVSHHGRPGGFHRARPAGVALVPAVFAGGLGRHKWHDRRALVERRRALCARPPYEQLCSWMRTARSLRRSRRTSSPSLEASSGRRRSTGASSPAPRREAVISARWRAGLEVSEEPIDVVRLGRRPRRSFVTSSIRGLCAVSELRGHEYFDSVPSARRLAEALWRSWSGAIGPVSGAARCMDLNRSGADPGHCRLGMREPLRCTTLS